MSGASEGQPPEAEKRGSGHGGVPLSRDSGPSGRHTSFSHVREVVAALFGLFTIRATVIPLMILGLVPNQYYSGTTPPELLRFRQMRF